MTIKTPMEESKRSEGKTFRIERFFVARQPIGGGSFGVVYDAFDSKTGQDAAIKVLRPDFIDDSDACARFEDEAAVAASIDHPTGLPVYGIGRTEDGSLYYVMKKVRGKTLEKLLNERGKNVADQQWLSRLLRIFHHVCEGVAAAHRRGVIHRDLKPENIVVSDEDFVTVIDWGSRSSFPRPMRPVPIPAPWRAWSWALQATCPPSRPGATRRPPILAATFFLSASFCIAF